MDEETNVGGEPGNSGLHWIAPLLILLVLILFGVWFCRTNPEPAKPEAPKPVNANANANTANTVAPSGNSNANRLNKRAAKCSAILRTGNHEITADTTRLKISDSDSCLFV